ncbi:ABC-2 type transport system permease protein [Nakamurella sp. UYEF19]|uniref:ABC transporter permease n=1 Tax=Nakamurella sp. UYEF19 TaxID=1756392 RepID=UPI003390DD1F
MSIDTRPTSSTTVARQRYAGLWTVLRLGLRQERLPLIIWTFAVAATVLSTVSAIKGLYPTAADRAQLVDSITANPAFLALTGPLTTPSLGGVTAWRVEVLGGLAVALMSVFTVVRRTRADEESGRAELLASGVLGRRSTLTAALLLAWTCAVVIGGIGALGAIGSGLPTAGALALGACLAGPGLVFGAVAAVGAQIFENARTATASALVALATAFAVRAAADLWSGAGWLRWLSPLGWVAEVGAFGAQRWAVLLLFVASALVLSAIAIALSGRRDLGHGLFAAGLGPAGNTSLRSGWSLALRLHRTSWIGWATGFLVLGLLTGSLATGAAALIGDNERIRQLVEDLGGTGAVSDELLSALAGIAGLVAGGYVVSATLRLRVEEEAGRAETVLCTGLSRTRWWSGHLLCSLGGSAGLLVICGLATSAVRWNVGPAGAGLAAMAVQIPAVLVIGGVTSAVIAVAPKFSSASWGLLGLAALLGPLGELLGLPATIRDLSPYTLVPALPAAPMTWAPVVALIVGAAAFTAVGFRAFTRRDLG